MEQVIIIGGGISGLSTALYTAKAGLKTVVFDQSQSQITRVSHLQNYPGIKEVTGHDFINTLKEQVSDLNVTIHEEEVTRVEKKEHFFIIHTTNNRFEAKYVVLATNINQSILESFNITSDTNPFVPSRKIKSAMDIGYEGETQIENLYLSGLLTNIESQAIIVAGQGAHIGIKIASKELNKPYMWHDV